MLEVKVLLTEKVSSLNFCPRARGCTLSGRWTGTLGCCLRVL